MSWGRGFFRAWLILSAIWIGLGVYIAKPLTFSWLWKAPKYEITSVKGNKVTLDSAQSHSDLLAALTEFMTLDGVDLSKRDDILAGINSRYETAGEQAELSATTPPTEAQADSIMQPMAANRDFVGLMD